MFGHEQAAVLQEDGLARQAELGDRLSVCPALSGPVDGLARHAELGVGPAVRGDPWQLPLLRIDVQENLAGGDGSPDVLVEDAGGTPPPEEFVPPTLPVVPDESMVPYVETLRDVWATLDKAVREQLVREGVAVDNPRLLSQMFDD
jgi:hypothetical protein